MIFPVSNGFGSAGLTVTDAGRTFRFIAPVSKIQIVNDGSDAVYVGANERIVNSVGDVPGADAMWPSFLPELTQAEALAKGVRIAASGVLELESPLDDGGQPQFYAMWFMCAVGETATVHGGAIGF